VKIMQGDTLLRRVIETKRFAEYVYVIAALTESGCSACEHKKADAIASMGRLDADIFSPRTLLLARIRPASGAFYFASGESNVPSILI
jgi:hypothetical protein